MNISGLLRLAVFLLLLSGRLALAQTTLVPAGSTWSYLRGTAEASNPTSAWRANGYPATGWLTGAAPFYFGFTSGTGTQLSDMLGSYSTVFLRQTFTVPDPAQIGQLILNTTVDDAFVAWINGVEVARSSNAPATLLYTSVATTSLAASPPAAVAYTLADPRALLSSGMNTLAVMTFNSAKTGSDFYQDFSLVTSAADATTPTVVSVTPAPNATLPSLTQITVVFSEPVRGVSADDLFINQDSATAVSGSGTTWVFTAPATPSGPVNIAFNPAHGISDLATPAHEFDYLSAGANWSYTLVDQAPPVVALLNPPAGATVTALTQLEVTFNEPVLGVNAADLLINGTPATGLTNPATGKYVFSFPAPPTGPVAIAWAGAHGITDISGNAFAGGAWSYTLDPAALTSGVRINEFVAGNQNGIKDEDGETQDWIELYNPTAGTVDLTGWALTDDSDQPEQWLLPAWTLGPGKYLIIYCSGKDRHPAQATAGQDNLNTLASPRLHTNFNLACPGGEYLALSNSQSPRVTVTSFAPNYPEQRNDTSYGVDSTNVWRYYSTPTPGAANGASTISGVTAEVVFNVGHGFYNAPFQLYFSCPSAGASIRYTLDGSVPTATTGLPFTTPITISTTSTVRVAAFLANSLSSRVGTRTYIFPAAVRSQSNAPAGFPAAWGPTGSTVTADYEVDPTVTGNSLYSANFESDLLAVPTMSIVMKTDDMFGPSGINSNPGSSGVAWERGASLELIFPDGRDGFQQDCGMRIQGGYGRTASILKHSFRPLFKGDYGESKLSFPLFSGSPVQDFDTFTLRAGMNNSYVLNTGEAVRATFTEDEWVRQTQRAMGQVSGYGGFFHLYINGLYWGLYNATERPSAPFAASHLGGAKENWDDLNSSEAVDGVKTAWTALQTLCSTGTAVRYITDQTDWTSVMQYLDVDNFIDYMLLNFYAGNQDWDDHNWYAARLRVAGAGYKFFAWDGERTLETPNPSEKTNVNQADKPSRIYAALRGSTNTATAALNAANVEFRIRFADHVQKHLFNNGPLTPTEALNRWNAVEAQLDLAVIGESARWGDKLKKPPYTRNAEFMTEVTRKRNVQFPQRTATALTALRAAKLYPPTTLVAPAYNQNGGRVPLNFGLTLSSTSAGNIYYTTDGSDPRQAWTSTTSGGSAVDWSGSIAATALAYSGSLPLTSSTTVKARLRDSTGLWSALSEATFQVAEAGVPLRITEIMYNPPGGDAYEFVEVMNTGATTVDLSLMTWEGINFTFLRSTTLGAGQRLVLANSTSPSLWAARYPGVTPLGYYGGALSNGGEYLALRDAAGNIVTSVNYDDEGRWPTAPDGGGKSLEIIDPLGDPNLPENWRASAASNGTPGAPNQAWAAPALRLNEVLARNAGAVNNGGVAADYVELLNTGADLNIGGWSVRVQGSAAGACVFPANTIVPAGGFLTVWAGAVPSGYQTAQALGDLGGFVTLNNASGILVDSIQWGAQLPDKSIGRVGAGWVLTAPSPGAANVAAAVAAQLAVNEFLAQLAGTQTSFIELMNRSTTLPAALSGLYLQVGSAVQRLRPLSFVAPGGFIALPLSSTDLDLTLPTGAGSIALLDAAANTLDTLAWTSTAAGVAQGRLPNGTGALAGFANNATPGAANAQIAWSGPLLNEIMARNEGAVLDASNNWPDWIELANPTAGPYDLSGLRLRLDEAADWIFPAGSIVPASGYLRIWCDPSRAADATNTHVALNDRGGSVRLFNVAGQQVDAIDYGPQAANLSFGKTGGQWQLLAAPTPGAANSGAAALGSAAGLRINEWLASGTGADWLELYNTGPQPVELSGLYLTDDPSLAGRTKSVIRSRSFIAPRGTALFAAVNDAASAPNATAFALAATGESLRLYAVDLTLLDGVDFGDAIYDVSRGRYPDGSANIINFTTTRSPDAPNYLDTDGDGLPDAWEIAHGLNPLVNDAAGDPDGDGRTNLQEYLAGTDPKDPASTLAIGVATAAAGGFTISFNAQAGKTYSVQWKTSLTDAGWQKLIDFPAGSARAVQAVDTTAVAPSRFYRVVTPRQP